jgi:hypothetical protein
MARTAKAKNADLLREAAVDYFCSRSHNAWRRRLLETNPQLRGQPRMRPRGGVMVDINKPWANLDPKAKADNKQAAYDAYEAVTRFPGDREAASNYVHERWMERNKRDKGQPKALFKPYARLLEVEKDKDRAHVDQMTKALRTLATKAKPRSKSKAAKPAATKTIRVDAATWRRLDAAAKNLSAALGCEVSIETLLVAGVEAVAAVSKSVVRKKKR